MIIISMEGWVHEHLRSKYGIYLQIKTSRLDKFEFNWFKSV